MAKPLSEDLRSRLIAAVNGGLSRRAAAKRFGVGAATAIRWGSGLAGHRHDPSQTARRGQTLASHRGLSSGHPGGDRGPG